MMIPILGIATLITARDFFITPDGETVYYKTPPRVFVWRPEESQKNYYSDFIYNGEKPEQVRDPVSLFVFNQSRLLVSDSGSGEIKFFDRHGTLFRRFGKDSRVLKSPVEAARSPFGDIFVSDSVSRSVLVYDSRGNFQSRLSFPDEKDTGFEYPAAMAFAPDGSLFVLDSAANSVFHFSYDLKFIKRWGRYGNRPGEFKEPRGIVINRMGEIFIADTQNHRIQVFAMNGDLKRIIGKQVKGESEIQLLELPQSVALNREGQIAVADKGGSRIQFFSPYGEWLAGFRFRNLGEKGEIEAEASDIDFDDAGSLYVADKKNRRIIRFTSIDLFTLLGQVVNPEDKSEK